MVKFLRAGDPVSFLVVHLDGCDDFRVYAFIPEDPFRFMSVPGQIRIDRLHIQIVKQPGQSPFLPVLSSRSASAPITASLARQCL